MRRMRMRNCSSRSYLPEDTMMSLSALCARLLSSRAIIRAYSMIQFVGDSQIGGQSHFCLQFCAFYSAIRWASCQSRKRIKRLGGFPFMEKKRQAECVRLDNLPLHTVSLSFSLFFLFPFPSHAHEWFPRQPADWGLLTADSNCTRHPSERSNQQPQK